MKLIESVWVAVAVDDAEQIEGLCAVQIGHRMMPLIAADEQRLPFVRTEAERIARESGQVIRLIRLTTREVIETIDGRH